MKAMILCSSPRRDGNSRALGEAVAEGLAAAGHHADVIHADDIVQAFLKNCRTCRRPDGECTIADDFRTVFRSEEHTSALQSLMRISYAVFCLKKKKRTL